MKKSRAVRKTLSPNSAKLKHNVLHPSKGRSKPAKSTRRQCHRPADPVPRSSQVLFGGPSLGGAGGGKTSRKSAHTASARKGLAREKRRKRGRANIPTKGKVTGRDKGPSSAKARRRREREREESVSSDDDSESGSETGSENGSGDEGEMSGSQSGSESGSGTGEEGHGSDSDGSSNRESEVEFKVFTPVIRSERSPGEAAASRALRKLKKSRLVSRPHEAETVAMSTKYEESVRSYRHVIVEFIGKEITEGIMHQLEGLTTCVAAGTAKYDGESENFVSNTLKANRTKADEVIARLADLSNQIISGREDVASEMQAFMDESQWKLDALLERLDAKSKALKIEVKAVGKKKKGRGGK